MTGSSQVSHLHVYIDALKELSEEFGVRFKDFRDNEKVLCYLQIHLQQILISPTELQLEFIGIQNESDLENTYR